MPERNRLIHNRINIFSFLIFCIFILFGVRLFYLQIIHGAEYKRAGESQYFYDTGEHFDRGSIFFVNRSKVFSPAVAMSNEYDIAIDPKTVALNFKKRIEEGVSEEELKNNLYNKIHSAFEEYNSILSKNTDINTSSSSTGSSSSTNIQNVQNKISFLSKDVFFAKLKKENSSYEILSKNIPEDLAQDLMSQRIKGLVVNRKKSRVYFEEKVGAKVLGFVGFTDDKKTGLYGIERYYNDILEKKSVNNINFFAEVFSDFNSDAKDSVSSSKMLKNISSEGDLNLTIDINVQRYLNKTLDIAKNKWSPTKIGGIVMDINDGSIMGMEELPTFDPNNYQEVENISYYNNDLISGVYEMGSIIKPLTMAAALDSGVVNENTTYNDTGSITLNKYTIYNYDKMARGPNTSMQTILSKSLNVGIAFLVQQLGQARLSEYFHNFGLGEYTGIDLPNESAGLVANLDSKIMIDSVTAGYGQGIALTPIQTIRALAILGNGGKLVTPHIVDSIVYDNGNVKTIAQDEPQIVFQNASTSERISKILTKVVDEGMHVVNPRYTIAAKTGTAQIPNPATGKYYEDRYLHSFFGYFPATNPKYIIFLYQVHPKGAEYASQTLKESFFNLVDFLTNYYEILPDRK